MATHHCHGIDTARASRCADYVYGEHDQDAQRAVQGVGHSQPLRCVDDA